MATSVVTVAVGEDEAGMRLDRWFRRRYPALPQSHLNKIVRKGEIRVEGKRVEISTRLEAGQSVRVPPLEAPVVKPAVAPVANPADAEYLRSLILFEDRDVLVLDKPWGLASQGGSGTKRHVDGMLASLAEQTGRAAGAGASPRPRHVRRAALREVAQNGGRTRRAVPRARDEEDLLGACGGMPEAGERPHLAVSRQGRGDGRARRQDRGSRRKGAHARGPARRSGRAAFGHAVRDCR